MSGHGAASLYRKAVIALLLVTLVLVFTGCIHQIQPSAQPSPNTGTNASQNNTTNLGNDTVTVSNETNDTEDEEEEGPTLYDVRNTNTIRVEHPDGSLERVYLVGLRVPGVYSASRNVMDAECWDAKADEVEGFLRDTLRNKTLEIQHDSQQSRKAYVYVDNTNVNLEMIREGYALAMDLRDYDMRQEFREADKQAWIDEVGVWGDCQVESNRYEPSPDVVLSDYQLGPPSGYSSNQLDENANLQWFELTNEGDAPANLGHWAIRVDDGTAHGLEGPSLSPGESLTVYPGSVQAFPIWGNFSEDDIASNAVYLGKQSPFRYYQISAKGPVSFALYENRFGEGTPHFETTLTR